MRRFPAALILLAFTALLPASAGAAWWRSDDTLVTIDGVRYSGENFKRWWTFWKDADTPFPKTPEPYIDWLLLNREGERMELASDPGFRRQTQVFLKSRALLMLKYEEVDSRIAVTDAEVRARYERDYLPRWLVQRLEFRDADAAAAAWKELATGTVSVDELATRPPEQGGPSVQRENWLRPQAIDPGWAAIFAKAEVGAVVDPAEHEHGPGLFRLKEKKGGDEEDFARLREEIRRDLWKERENALTSALLNRLREKYEVVVDAERIEALDLTSPEGALTDAVVIATNRQSVTEKDFVTIARRHLSSRAASAHAFKDPEDLRKLKGEIVGGILGQNLVDWEALDRHYEEKEPFQWEYEFHVAHRLVLALEQRLFAPGAKVGEDEVKRHYGENLGRYTQPALVKLYILDDTQGPVDQVRADVLVGVPFTKALRDRFEGRVAPREFPANHLEPEIKAVVDRLAVGETSPLFSAQGSQALVHLVERTPERPVPLEQAAGTIRTRLVKEKMDRQRSEYLALLKARSKIEVKERQWQSVRKELGEAP